MSAHVELEVLETLSLGGHAPEAEEHVAGCAECARELAWLKAERAMIARRPSPPVTHLWAEIEKRLEAPQPVQIVSRRRGPRWAWRTAVAATGVAAAAVLLLVVRVKPPALPAQAPAPVATAKPHEDYHPDPRALAALDRAEADYRDAAKILEAEYDRLRPHMDAKLAARWDETLTRARVNLGEARSAVAAQDINARMQVLDGYAGYLRSLRNVVQHSEEANP